MSRKHDMKPYEDSTPLIKLCDQNMASLFFFGNHSKKRPQNITIGRLYDSKILDMIELGIESYKKMGEFTEQANFNPNLKPILIFQGEHFEYSEQFIRIRNLFGGTPSLFISRYIQTKQCRKIRHRPGQKNYGVYFVE